MFFGLLIVLVKLLLKKIKILSMFWSREKYVSVWVFWTKLGLNIKEHLPSHYLILTDLTFRNMYDSHLTKKVLYLRYRISPSCKAQRPRTDLNKRSLPRPKTTTAWKLTPHRSKISKNWNPPHWVHLHKLFKNWFLLIWKQLYSNYIQTHFTK